MFTTRRPVRPRPTASSRHNPKKRRAIDGLAESLIAGFRLCQTALTVGFSYHAKSGKSSNFAARRHAGRATPNCRDRWRRHLI